MKTALLRTAIAIIFFAACSTAIWAQEAVVNHNVILRRDPATTSPPLAHLPSGTRLTLVDVGPSSGFYHVKTEDDQVGWVFAKFVSITPVAAPATTTPAVAGTDSCDASLAAHVYHPKRLLVKQECISVRGTIVDATAPQSTHHADGTRHEADGDTHGWLKLDAGFENLLNDGNLNNEGGNLVFEIICRFPVTQVDAKTACHGYSDHVVLPPVGSHVKIVGRYVQDTFHAQWNERQAKAGPEGAKVLEGGVERYLQAPPIPEIGSGNHGDAGHGMDLAAVATGLGGPQEAHAGPMIPMCDVTYRRHG